MIKIISGGQTGIDQLALFVAFARRLSYPGISTGGTAPRGWWTTAGSEPRLSTYGLRECSTFGYPARTRKNILDADLTILIHERADSPGERLTRAVCGIQNKPYIEFDLTAPQLFDQERGRLYQLCKAIRPQVINVAGNSEQTCRGIYVRAYPFMVQIIDTLVEFDMARTTEFESRIDSASPESPPKPAK